MTNQNKAFTVYTRKNIDKVFEFKEVQFFSDFSNK